MQWDAKQLALVREAAIAGHSLSGGLSALSKANYAQDGLYGHAFFGLSVGMERTLKLIFILDMLINDNRFPADKELRGFSHNLVELFEKAEEIRVRHAIKPASLVSKGVERSIIVFLSSFAESTRYYNLDFLTDSKKVSKGVKDPIAEWFTVVGERIFAKHLTPRRRAEIEHNAKVIGKLMGDYAHVAHTAEDGSALNTARDASYQAGLNKTLQKYGTFYCARICRYMYVILSSLHRISMSDVKLLQIPFLDELYYPFDNEDSYLIRQKTFPPRS